MSLQPPQGLSKQGRVLMPSMQLFGSRSYVDTAYPNTAQAFTEVWKDSGFYHSDVSSPEKFWVAMPGRYEINIDYKSFEDRTIDLFYELSRDGGASYVYYMRNEPMNNPGVGWEGAIKDLLILTGPEVLQLRIYVDNPSGPRTVDTTLTLVMLNRIR
jgi:hypothetical protein